MRLLRAFPPVSVLVALVSVLPACGSSCACGPTFHASAGDQGCGSGIDLSCPDAGPLPNGMLENGFLGGCALVCSPGYQDCNGDRTDGCESSKPCWTPGGGDAGGDGALATLSAAPNGLAVCAGRAFFIDGAELRAVSLYGSPAASTVGSADGAAGGLACDGARLYWPVAATSDAAPGINGAIASVGLDGGAAQTVAAGVDPGRGVEVDPSGGGVYWLARSLDDGGAGLVLSPVDGGAPTWVLPAEEGDAGLARTFAVSSTSAFGVTNGQIWTMTLDAGPASILDGGAVGVASAFDLPYAVVRDAPSDTDAGDLDAGDASDASQPTWTLKAVLDDGGTLTLASLDAPVAVLGDPVGDLVYVASDTSIARVPTMGGVPVTLAGGQLHITDIAIDDHYVYWLTRGDSSDPGTLRRAPR